MTSQPLAAPATAASSLRSASTRSSSGQSDRLSTEPSERSSSPTTWSPSAIKRAPRRDPMKPAAPVTRHLMCSPCPLSSFESSGCTGGDSCSSASPRAARPFDGSPEPLLEGDLWLPAHSGASKGDVGTANLGVVHRSVGEHNLGVTARQRCNHLCELTNGDLTRVAEIHRSGNIGMNETPDSFDEVVDVAQRPSLLAVAVHGQLLARKRLLDKGGNRASIALAQARAKGIEDADDPHRHAVGAVIRHHHRFREALGFVVDATRPDRIDVPPIALWLGMDFGIAVDLRGRSHEEPGRLRLGETQCVQRAERAYLQGVYRMVEIVARRSRGSEVQHPVHIALHEHIVRHVVAFEPESLVRDDAAQVAGITGQEGVKADYLPTLLQQPLAEMRTDEARASSDYCS